jgi:hypothetical protein
MRNVLSESNAENYYATVTVRLVWSGLILTSEIVFTKDSKGTAMDFKWRTRQAKQGKRPSTFDQVFVCFLKVT